MPDLVHGWGTAAGVARCSPTQLRRMVRDGVLIAHKTDEGMWEFDRHDLLALAARSEAADTGATQDDAGAPPSMVDANPPEPQPPAVPQVAAAFQLLNAGRPPADLVVELGLSPDEALRTFGAWKQMITAQEEQQEIQQLLELHRWLRGLGWSARQVVAAYQQVAQHKAVLATSGYTGDQALALLDAVRARVADFAQARALLRALPRVEQLQQQAAQAVHDARQAEARASLANQRAAAIDAEFDASIPYLQWLRLARALHDLVHDAPDAVTSLRAALLEPCRDPAAYDNLAQRLAPADQQEVLRELAQWAAAILPDHVVLHRQVLEDRVERAHQRGCAEGLLLSRMAPVARAR